MMQNPDQGIQAGTKLRLTITDPWETVTDLESPILNGVTLQMNSPIAIVIRLDRPILSAGLQYDNLLARPRRLEDNFSGINGNVFCALVSISYEEAMTETLIKLTDFNGRLMLMGDVTW